jgi:hypothetical protein
MEKFQDQCVFTIFCFFVVISSARNENSEVLVYLLKAKESCNHRKMGKDKWK